MNSILKNFASEEYEYDEEYEYNFVVKNSATGSVCKEYKEQFGNGVYKEWHSQDSGELKFLKRYKCQRPCGEWTKWYNGGKLEWKEWYCQDSGKLEWKEWYRSEGTLKLREEWYSQEDGGKLKSSKMYTAAGLNGESKEWYSQEDGGKLKSCKMYFIGKLDGEFKQWSSNGELEKSEVYEFGEKI